MYSQTAINTLNSRVGWVNPIDSSFIFAFEARNKEATSGRDFQFYHGYVTGKNIVAILPNKNETEAEFNQFIYDLRIQSVLEALYLIIDKDPNFDPSFNHDNYINERITLFDEVIGLVHALKVLSLLRNSIRSNRIERINAEGIEVEIGFLTDKLNQAILAATPPFNKKIKVFGTKIW